MRTRHIALAPFLQRLRDRIDALDAEELRELITAHAAALDPAARMPFLATFDGTHSADAEPGDDSLRADVADLVARLREGEYFDGWGWDDDLHEERAWGDESWVDEMEDLFARAGQAFVAGDLVVARDAYGGLLDALLLDEEVGTFTGPAAASDMLGVDLVEAKARALRALYETSDPHDRVDALASAIARWRYLGDRIGLRAIAEALPRELPGLEVFLDEWIARLRPAAHGELPNDDRALLVEAAAWRDGPNGVGSLATEHGAENPELFVDWVDALIGAGRSGDATDACAQALANVPAFGEPRAQIAERLATVSTAAADRLDAARQAWRAAPTALRLRRLAALADDMTLAAEADALDRTAAPARLAAALRVLTGRVDEAGATLSRAESLGWSSGDHAGPLVVPILLLAAAGKEPGSSERLRGATTLLSAVDRPTWHDVHRLLDGPDEGNDDETPGERQPPELSALLIARVGTLHATDEQRRAWLAWARTAADARITAIVEAKHRGAYDRAAQLATACAEAVAVTEGSVAAARAIGELRDRFPRHVAFRAALDAATERSPLLPAAPRPRR
jgi:hypothetical protein